MKLTIKDMDGLMGSLPDPPYPEDGDPEPKYTYRSLIFFVDYAEKEISEDKFRELFEIFEKIYSKD